MRSEDPEFVELASFLTEGEAHSVAGMLQAQDIPASVIAQATGGMLPIPTATTGLTVLVPLSHLESARRLLTSAHESQHRQDEEDRAFARTGYGKKSASDISSGLAEIRARRRLSWIVFFSLIPVSFVVVGLIQHPATMVLMFSIWVTTLGIVNFRVYNSRCPACGEYFHKKSIGSNVLVRHCLHCGISLHDEGNDV